MNSTSTVRNPLTKRRIKRSGATAKVPAVKARLRGQTFSGSKRSGSKGFPVAAGSKLQVWNGTAHHTLGGVTRAGLFQDKYGRIRFRSRSVAAKRNPAFMARAQAMKGRRIGRRA